MIKFFIFFLLYHTGIPFSLRLSHHIKTTTPHEYDLIAPHLIEYENTTPARVDGYVKPTETYHDFELNRSEPIWR